MTENKYGNLLDKYMNVDNSKDYNGMLDKEKQKYVREGEDRYGHLLDYAKPDNSMLELMVKIEDDNIERRKQEAREEELGKQRRQARIEEERRKEQERIDNNSKLVESIMARKESEIKAAENARKEKRKADEEQQRIYNTIDDLMKISLGIANAYIQAMKEENVI